MRLEPAHSALPEEDVRGRGWVPSRGLRVREEAAPPPSLSPPALEGRELSGAVSCLRASLCLSLALKDSSFGIYPKSAAPYLGLVKYCGSPALVFLLT